MQVNCLSGSRQKSGSRGKGSGDRRSGVNTFSGRGQSVLTAGADTPPGTLAGGATAGAGVAGESDAYYNNPFVIR